MNTLARLFLAGCALALSAQIASAQAPSRPFLTGKWAGVLTVVDAPGLPDEVIPPFPTDPGRQLGFRLDIAQTNLTMQLQAAENNWIEIGRDADLRTNEQGRTAVVVTALGNPAQPPLETMVLNIVRWDEDTIGVFMSRVTTLQEGQEEPQHLTFLGRLNRADF